MCIYMSSILQAGIVSSLDALVKEFVAATEEEKKVVFSRIEEEAEKLKDSAARYFKAVWMPCLTVSLLYRQDNWKSINIVEMNCRVQTL